MTRLERAGAKRIRRAARTQPSGYAVRNAAAGADGRRRWWDRSWAPPPAGAEPEHQPKRTRRPKDVALRAAILAMKASQKHRQPRKRRPQGGAR